MDVRPYYKLQAARPATDVFGNNVIVPGISWGWSTDLVLDLRDQAMREAGTAAYDLPDADSYYIAIDNDWDRAHRKLLRSGISVTRDERGTIFRASLPDTGKVESLRSAIDASPSKA